MGNKVKLVIPLFESKWNGLMRLSDTECGEIVKNLIRTMRKEEIVSFSDPHCEALFDILLDDLRCFNERKEEQRERVKEYRQRKKQSESQNIVTNCNGLYNNVTDCTDTELNGTELNGTELNGTEHNNIIIENLSKDKFFVPEDGDTGSKKRPKTDSASPLARNNGNNKSQNSSTKEIVDMYNEICISLPKVVVISEARTKAIQARLKRYKDVSVFRELFEKAERSDFLKGANNRNWNADFDWLTKDQNMAKVLDGKYDNKCSDPVGNYGWISEVISEAGGR